MRAVHPGLAAHLAGAVTTLARCWTLNRADGVVMGFTDHDRDLVIDGVVHKARSGLEASEAQSELGFAVASLDVAGVLHSAGITEADISRGLYDDAEVAIHIVDWSEPANRQRLDVLTIGEITRGDTGFTAELRGAGHRHDEERGRLYAMRCGADLGDARCTVAVDPLAATIAATDGRGWIAVTGLAAVPAGRFTGGRLAVLGGANAGHAVEIRRHHLDDGLHRIELWLDAPRPMAIGDAVSLSPGCDKSFATCRDRFGNSVNFQGFPHIPGSDFLFQVATEDGGQAFDGGSLFR
jgi:uncharacterized phage protein (TIGR02218 family)